MLQRSLTTLVFCSFLFVLRQDASAAGSPTQETSSPELPIQDARFWLTIAIRWEALGNLHLATRALSTCQRLDRRLPGLRESQRRQHMARCPVSHLEAKNMMAACRWRWQHSTSLDLQTEASVEFCNGTISVTRVDHGSCAAIVSPPSSGGLGSSFRLSWEHDSTELKPWETIAEWAKEGGVVNPRPITDPDDVDIVAVEGCEKAGSDKPWHTLHVQVSGMEERGLLSWVQGTDPFLSARLFCRFESLPPSALLPLYSLIVARNAAHSLRALNPRAPPWDIPADQYDAFTMSGAIQVTKHYVDESAAEARDNYNFGFYTASRHEIERMVNDVKERKQGYYGETDDFLYSALDAIGGLKGMAVVIMGSLEPWYEAVCIGFGASTCSTVEYNALQFDHPLIRTYRSQDFFALEDRPTFDVGFSISSFEHDGLGRYGDELDPNGDLTAMHDMESVIKPDGLLLLAVPVGKDLIKWNAHRKYGRTRLSALLSNWTLVAHPGLSKHRLDDPSPDTHFQPVLVLKNRRPPAPIDWDALLSQ